jgi:hypothetical protein
MKTDKDIEALYVAMGGKPTPDTPEANGGNVEAHRSISGGIQMISIPAVNYHQFEAQVADLSRELDQTRLMLKSAEERIKEKDRRIAEMDLHIYGRKP